MSDSAKTILLGILEGLSEFLPISSTGHLIVGAALLDLPESLRDSFTIFIQLGALLAVLLHYRRELLHQARALHRDADVRRFWISILIASLPAAITGLTLREAIKAQLFHPEVVGLMLILGGLAFLFVERRQRPATARGDDTLPSISPGQALFIGLVQTLALIPGVSRSGASILGGLQIGLDRHTATRFSFYLAIPLLGGAAALEFLDVAHRVAETELALLLLGMLVSALTALPVISWLLRFVSQHSFTPFGWYRILAGLALLLATGTGQL